eukprot:4056526-Pleurochrysis_carterae.AAC.1
MEVVGDALQRLRPLVQSVRAALRPFPSLEARAVQSIGAAALLRYTELAISMGDSFGIDALHPVDAGVSRAEMTTRLLENLDDLGRFFNTSDAESKRALAELQASLAENIRQRWRDGGRTAGKGQGGGGA